MTDNTPMNVSAIVNLFFETGILAKTPRSGFHFLGQGKQSVAEHLHRNAMIGLTLALMDGTVDVGKVVELCLLHDLAEARTSDLNYTHQRYVKVDEEAAFEAAIKDLPFADRWRGLFREYKERVSRESLLAKDADNLEWLLSLKEQQDLGHPTVHEWIVSIPGRLRTDLGKMLAEKIMTTRSDAWWFKDPNDEWWVSRTKPGTRHEDDKQAS